MGRTRRRALAGQEQGRNRAEQSKAEPGRSWAGTGGGARNVPDRSLKGAGQEYSRGWAEAVAGEEKGRSRAGV